MLNTKFWLSAIFLLGFTLRLLTSAIGYHGDLNNNISWGKVANEKGLNGFYDGYYDWEYSAPNQPPLTIFVLSGALLIEQKITDLIWYLNNNFSIFPSPLVWFWESWGEILMIKLPSILADFGIGYLIYKYFNNLKKEALGIKLFALWIFNPVVWYNSAVWGQTDGLVNLLGLVAVICLIKKKLPVFSIFITLSMLFKGSLGIFMPVLFFYALLQRYRLIEWIKSIVYSLLTIVLISIWFHPQIDLFKWLFDLYTQRFIPGEIGFLTANAFNVWWLVDSGKVYDSTLYFGLSARNLGILVTLLGNFGVMYWLSKKPNEKRFFASLVLVSLLSFLFMTRIHERYLYTFFPISTLLLGITPSYWRIYALFSLIHLINLYNLFWVPPFPFLEQVLTISAFINSLALINIVLFLSTLRHLRHSNI